MVGGPRSSYRLRESEETGNGVWWLWVQGPATDQETVRKQEVESRLLWVQGPPIDF